MPPSNPGTKAARMREVSDLTRAKFAEEEARKQAEKLKRKRYDMETRLGSFDSALRSVDALIVSAAHSTKNDNTVAWYGVASDGFPNTELGRSMLVERGEALAEHLRKDGFEVLVYSMRGLDGSGYDGTYQCVLRISW